MEVVVGLWIVCGIAAAAVTIQKGRDDALSAAVFGFVLGPLGLVMAAMSSPPERSRVGRICTNCHRVVAQDRDLFCDHCGEQFAR
jgi:hypothetical protein